MKIRWRKRVCYMALGAMLLGQIPAIDPPVYAVNIETEELPIVDNGPYLGGFFFQSGRPNSRGYVESEAEEQIYSYVQCPASHYEDKRWVGDWPSIEAGGQTFWGFGCGICCLSNMVSTLTDEKMTPDEMYAQCKKHGKYHPESGYGALSWKQLKKMAEHFNLQASLGEKPEYELFQADISGSDTAVILVSRYNDKTLWSDTGGHYVNIWEYDPDTDTVFVTDSSSIHNRERVKLADIYHALKTSSDYQYMCVSAGK